MIAALALMLAACAGAIHTEASFEVGPGFSEAQRAAILDALSQWGAVYRGSLRVGPGDVRIVLERPGSHRAHFDAHGLVIRIAPGLDARTFRHVALHELGHAIGLGHTAGGVMHEDGNATELGPWDVAECRAKGVCE